MSTALPAMIDHAQQAIALASAEIDPKILETVVVNGDLSKLTPSQRLSWYRARCDAAGLDPRTTPFQYLSLQGKLTLYATKTASEQLTGKHKLSVEILSRELDSEQGIYTVFCRATWPDGHFIDDQGSLFIGGLKGEPRSNAYMKCTTKAKRRTVLSACGLGMLDESEVDSIPHAQRVEPDRYTDDNPGEHHVTNFPSNETGHGSGRYASNDTVAAFKRWLEAFVADKNKLWAKHWENHPPEVRERIKAWKNGQLVTTVNISGHIQKWAKAEGIIESPGVAKLAQYDKLSAIAWDREFAAVENEATEYTRKEWADRSRKILMPGVPRPTPEPQPEDVSQEVDDTLDGVTDAGDEWTEGRE